MSNHLAEIIDYNHENWAFKLYNFILDSVNAYNLCSRQIIFYKSRFTRERTIIYNIWNTWNCTITTKYFCSEIYFCLIAAHA